MGLFITFEGVEGCGKTTQFELLKGYFEGRGEAALALREPGGTELGERVRPILLNSGTEPIDPWAELFLYEACRAQLTSKVIRPALKAGNTVITDRFYDSTVAYQGYGRGLDVKDIKEINRLASGGLKPDVTFLIDCPPEVGIKRAWDRIRKKAGEKEDRFEKEAMEFHRKVREGYLRLAGEEPGRIKVIDGTGEIRSIHREICDIIEEIKGRKA